MNHSKPYLLLAAALLAAAALTTQAQTWQTVDDFQYTAGCRAYGSDITTDPSTGVLYAVGGADTDASGNYRLALVNAADSQGTNWTTLTQAHEPGWTWGHYRAVAVSGSRLFVGGNGRKDGWPSGDLGWLIRESVDGGNNWVTTDDLYLQGDKYAGCSDIAIHPNGAVYASGSSTTFGRIIRRRAAGESQFTTVYASNPSEGGSSWAIGIDPHSGSIVVAGDRTSPNTGQPQWMVLRSPTGDANTWQTVDTFSSAGWTSGSAEGVLVTSDGTSYVSGWAYNTTQRNTQWVVRSSSDGGNTWAISDNFSYGGSAGYVLGLTQDAAGKLYVCGQAANKSGKVFWIVRKGTPTTTKVKQGRNYIYVNTVQWTTSDVFQLAPGKTALPLGITADASGNLFVCGRAQDAAGIEHFIVRKLTP